MVGKRVEEDGERITDKVSRRFKYEEDLNVIRYI